MEIKSVGEVIEQPDGRLLFQYWIVDGCSYPFTADEEQELIAIAKQNGTYRGIKINSGSLPY